jgi:hypothetical protein
VAATSDPINPAPTSLGVGAEIGCRGVAGQVRLGERRSFVRELGLVADEEDAADAPESPRRS